MIIIIDYKAGNAPSVKHAVNFLGYEAKPTRHPEDIGRASFIILPGVGNAKATVDSLHEMGLLPALEETVLRGGVPFLGICVGMQILFQHSQEESTDCLGWLKGRVVKYDTSKVRVPQMGWNKVSFVKDIPCDIADGFYYFVNSYHVRPENESNIWGVADYNGKFVAAIKSKNIFGTQFHLEKSGEAGLRLLKCFLEQ
jgi:glutamine amidotransferase